MSNRRRFTLALGTVALTSAAILSVADYPASAGEEEESLEMRPARIVEHKPPAPIKELAVGAQCGDVTSDASNCGSCGRACGRGQICSSGHCQAGTAGTASASVAAVQTAASTAALTALGTWTERGPFIGGRLDGIAVTSAGSILIVGSPGGGIWRRSEGGGLWAPAAAGPEANILHLEWDVNNTTRLYALTWNGLWVSTDAGNNWSALVSNGSAPGAMLPLSGLTDPKPFAQLQFSPTQSVIFASYGCNGIYYSFDGTNFTQHFPFTGGSSNPDNCIGTIATDPISKKVHFSTLGIDGFAPAHVFRGTCAWGPGAACLTWQAANTGLPNNSRVGALANLSFVGNADDLVAQLRVNSNIDTYTTFDGGDSWALRSSLPQWDPRALAYPGTTDQILSGKVLSDSSLDLGNTWTNFAVTNQHPDTRALTLAPALSRLYTTTDGANNDNVYANITRWNWSAGVTPSSGVNMGTAGLGVWQTYYAGVIPRSSTSSPTRVFLGAQDNGALCSDNGGSTWTTAGVPSGTCGDHFTIQYAPSNPSRAYDRNCSLSFQRSDNARSASSCSGVTWTSVTPTGYSNPIYWSRNSIAVHNSDQNKVYFAFSSNVGFSTDGGNTFTTKNLTGNARPISLFWDATSFGSLLVGTEQHGAYESSDNGAHWSAVGLNTGTPPEVVWAVTRVITGFQQKTLWLATTNGLYRKVGTGSLTLVLGGGGYIVNDIEVDPTCSTRVYAAMGYGGGRLQHRGGVLVSTDNGGSWTSLTGGLGLHEGPVTDVEVDVPDSHFVYASSYGRGFWRYDWGANLPACQQSP
jgi:hypothetical protein